ncbi:MAG TPA: TIR domain-containing protein [Thermoanaerobaculia bacterium]
MEKPKYDVFLSHATPDKPAVEELARILTNRGFSPWLDKWNLIPGDPWQEAIEKALEDCAACAVCLGPSGTGPWQNEEMRAAIDQRVSDRSRQFRVIPVLLPGSERGEPSRYPAFLRATTWVEFRETLDDEKALHRLICGIRGIPPGPDPGEAVAEGARPYRGLQVFDVGDALFFFGREALTEWLLDKLRTDRSGSRFLAIVGPSGSGKSSLARAGLLASLKSGKLPGSDIWPIAICKPGAQPLESLAVALSGAPRLGDSPSALRDLIRDLGADSRMLHLTTRLSLRDAPADRRLVVLIDQFEEVFTLCPEEAQRRAIIDNLLHAATVADGQTVVVLTLRADFYGRCAAYPDLAAAVSDRQSLVGPMTRGELQSAIERPAYLAGCELEGGLADLLLNEVESQPGSLPLLEHSLLQIWQRREGGRRLTIAAYREIGGVAGALEKHAEEVYAGFSEEEKETCRQIFLRLVQVDEQGRATKRRLGLDELASASVVSRLTDARLLTTDQEKQPTVELAHEALLNNWARLKQWIEQDREALRTRRRLDEAMAEWLGRNRDPAFLLEGGRLAQVEEWAENHKDEMGLEARELLAASIAERDRERQREIDQAKALEEEQRRRADAEHQRAEEQMRAGRRFKSLSVGLMGILVVAFIAGGIALRQWRKSERQRKIALAEQLAQRSRLVFSKDPMISLLLSIQATKLAQEGGQPHLPVAERTLRNALFTSQGFPLATGKIRAASLSSDGTRMALAGTNGEISVWNLESAAGPKAIITIPHDQLSGSVHHLAASVIA